MGRREVAAVSGALPAEKPGVVAARELVERRPVRGAPQLVDPEVPEPAPVDLGWPERVSSGQGAAVERRCCAKSIPPCAPAIAC